MLDDPPRVPNKLVSAREGRTLKLPSKIIILPTKTRKANGQKIEMDGVCVCVFVLHMAVMDAAAAPPCRVRIFGCEGHSNLRSVVHFSAGVRVCLCH